MSDFYANFRDILGLAFYEPRIFTKNAEAPDALAPSHSGSHQDGKADGIDTGGDKIELIA